MVADGVGMVGVKDILFLTKESLPTEAGFEQLVLLLLDLVVLFVVGTVGLKDVLPTDNLPLDVEDGLELLVFELVAATVGVKETLLFMDNLPGLLILVGVPEEEEVLLLLVVEGVNDVLPVASLPVVLVEKEEGDLVFSNGDDDVEPSSFLGFWLVLDGVAPAAFSKADMRDLSEEFISLLFCCCGCC